MKKILIPILMLCMGYANQVKAEDTDLTKFENVIYVAPATVNSSDGTEINLSICMNNTAAIRGFQFDMVLPEGMTAKKTAKGKYVVSLDSKRLEEDDEHTLTVGLQDDGAIRFLCGSQYDEVFKGTSGQIATMTVNIEDMTEGSYPIKLKAMKLTETDISKFYEVEEVITTLTVSTATSIKEVNAAVENGNIYDLQGRKVVKADKKGLYIRNGKKEVIRK